MIKLIVAQVWTKIFSMTSAYDPELRKLAAEMGKELGMEEFI